MFSEQNIEVQQAAWRRFLWQIYVRWVGWFAIQLSLSLIVMFCLYGGFNMGGGDGIADKSFAALVLFVLGGAGLLLILCNWGLYFFRRREQMPPSWVSYTHHLLGFIFWAFAGVRYLPLGVCGIPLLALIVFALRRADVDLSSERFSHGVLYAGLLLVPMAALVLGLLLPHSIAGVVTIGLSWALIMLFNAVLSAELFRRAFEIDMGVGRTDRALLLEGYGGAGRYWRLGFKRAFYQTLYVLYVYGAGLGILSVLSLLST